MATTRTVLVLHGYSQNAYILSKRLGALRKECAKDNVELVFVDAPHILQPVDLVGTSSAPFGAPEAADTIADPALTPRAWWKINPDKSMAYGLQESIESIRDVLKTRRFHGVFGFSQGAGFAAIISALLEKPHVFPSFLVDGNPPHPPFEFCVSVAGFRLRDPSVNPLFDHDYETPTLHVIGKTDIIVVEERSRQLIDVSVNKRVEEHDGGHFVPSKGNWRKFLRDYMKDPGADHISPGLVASSSVPNSGTATPVGSEPMLKL